MKRPALALFLPLLISACGGHRAPPAFEPKGQTKCSVAMSSLRPLIVEWPSADRLDLEAAARKSILVVRYEGCEMEVLRDCRVEGGYGYSPATRQDDRVHIRDEDALYANIPIHAVKFEGALRSAGELTVTMSMVGRYEATRDKVRKSDLKGDCEGATHAIVSLTAGAFEFFTGAEDGSSGGVGLAGVGAGAKSAHEHTTLNRAGRSEACDKATNHDKEPPDGCGAVLRIELAAVEGVPANVPPATTTPGPAIASTVGTPVPQCAVGTMWDGARCAPLGATSFCPAGMQWSGQGCTTTWDVQRGLGQDGCPRGTSLDARTKNCTEAGGAVCPPGTRYEAGRGCMAGAAVQRAPSAVPRCSDGMVGLPGGAFVANGAASPVAPFCLDAVEVTVDAYKACVAARKCNANDLACEGDVAKYSNYGVAGRGNHPMNCVSWEQAVAFCAAQGKRLPSVHEWEWAARGGFAARTFPWGDAEPTKDQGCFLRGSAGTCAVGSYPASDSAHGVHDLAGNVSEWTSNVASGWLHAKGGAFSSAWDYRDLKVDYTHDHWPGNKPDRYPTVGFRCAR